MSRESIDGEASGGYGTSRRNLLASMAVAGVGMSGLGAVAAAQEREADVETFALEVSEDGWDGVAPARIAGQQNPTLELQAGRTYRIVWRNADGRPHAFAIQDQDGFEMFALRVLAVTADDVTIFDEPTANATETLVWDNVSAARVGYLALQPGPAQGNATRLAVQDVPVVSANETDGEVAQSLELLETSPVLMEQGAVQAVEFVADPMMGAYLDPNFPGTSQGAIQVGGENGANETAEGNATAGGNVTGGNVTGGGNTSG